MSRHVAAIARQLSPLLAQAAGVPVTSPASTPRVPKL